MTVDLTAILEEARRIAAAAGALLRERHRGRIDVALKGEVDLVTESDRLSEELVVEALCRAFPRHEVISEEGGGSRGLAGEGFTWFVDPLDGTTNYAHGCPWYSVCLGLEKDGEPLAGVVHAPEMGWELWAGRGLGAWLDGKRISVSGVELLDRALVATGFPYDRRTSRDNNVPELEAVMRRCQGVRRMGVASLDCAMVAAGWLDGYWEFKLHPWDISAGALLVLEAGGRVTDLDGAPFDSRRGRILASNGKVHDELLEVLRPVRGRLSA